MKKNNKKQQQKNNMFVTDCLGLNYQGLALTIIKVDSILLKKFV
jgi:hypothetical protein